MSAQPTRVFDLLQYQLTNFPKPDALAYKHDGVWNKISTQAFSDHVAHLALGLHKYGVQKGDKIANITDTNRPEWNFIDMAALSLGAVHVPIYANLTREDYTYILNDANIKLVFVSNRELYEIIQSIADNVPQLEAIVTYEEYENIKSWKTFEAEGKKEDKAALESISSTVSEDDLCMLIYTSGTTGTPKGVCLTHKNIISNCLVGQKRMYSNPQEKALSFLPLCHTFERIIGCMYLYSGCSIYYAENIKTIADDLKDVQPDVFATVPRMLEKVYDKILSKGNELKGLKYYLFKWSLAVGFDFDPDEPKSFWYSFQYNLLKKLVFPKWKEAFGGKVRAVVCGGASLQPRLIRLFWAADIPILEGYGLSETSPVITVNYPKKGCYKIGSVGTVIDGGEVKIAPDGEILYKGPNVMAGYHNKPDLTDEIFNEEGWLKTGDIGEFKGEFLFITDRKKEMFKTSGGKYVAPQVIENKMKESRFIEQVMVIGESRKFPAALIVPNFLYLKSYCEHKGIAYTSNEEMIEHALVKKKFAEHVQKYNQEFANYMQVKKYIVLDHEWTAETGELSPKLSLKRKVILNRYHSQIEALYKEVDSNEKVSA